MRTGHRSFLNSRDSDQQEEHALSMLLLISEALRGDRSVPAITQQSALRDSYNLACISEFRHRSTRRSTQLNESAVFEVLSVWQLRRGRCKRRHSNAGTKRALLHEVVTGSPGTGTDSQGGQSTHSQYSAIRI